LKILKIKAPGSKEEQQSEGVIKSKKKKGRQNPETLKPDAYP